MSAALVEEAIKKAAIAWVEVPGERSIGLWCMPLEGSLIMVSGPGEQSATGLADATVVSLRLRGDNGALILILAADVERLQPGTEDWTTVAPQLANKRLNGSGTADEQVARWARDDCAVVRLTPSEEDPITSPELPDVLGAEPPRETPARNAVRKPFRLHRVRRPRG